MGNPFVHAELASTDLPAAKSFYQALFDWTLNEIEIGGGMTYTLIGVGEGTGGGMMQQMQPGAPSAWMPYVSVADVAVATEKARALGAHIVRDVTPVMDMGLLAIVTDPTGAMLGLWQTTRS